MPQTPQVIDVQRPSNGGEAIDNLAVWYVLVICDRRNGRM